MPLYTPVRVINALLVAGALYAANPFTSASANCYICNSFNGESFCDYASPPYNQAPAYTCFEENNGCLMTDFCC